MITYLTNYVQEQGLTMYKQADLDPYHVVEPTASL